MSDFQRLRGNPGDVRETAERLRDAAENMREARLGIGRMMKYSNYSSRAVDAITESASEVRTALMQAQRRYSAAARALRHWAADMESAQTAATKAEQDHDAATTEMESARSAADTARSQSQSTDASDEEVTAAKTREKAASDRAGIAHTNRVAAYSRYTDAVDYYNDAARKAARAINQANEDTNDTWRDKARTVLKWFDDLIGNVLEKIDAILEVVGIALLVILVVVAVFALPGAGLLVAGLLVVGISAAIVKTVQARRGEASAGEAVVAWGFALLPGFGKIAGRVLKVGTKGGGKRVADKGARTGAKRGGTLPDGTPKKRNPYHYEPRHKRVDPKKEVDAHKEARDGIRDHVAEKHVEKRDWRPDRVFKEAWDDWTDDITAPVLPEYGGSSPRICRVKG